MVLIAHKAERAVRMESAPAFCCLPSTEPVPRHCPETMNLPEPNQLQASSSTADRQQKCVILPQATPRNSQEQISWDLYR